MITGKIKRKCIIIIIIALVVTILEINIGIISIPSDNEMIDYQFNVFTVSTVLAGFSFTTLGMLLGLSSEEFVKKLKNTDYMLKNSEKLVTSIVFFVVSIIISMLYLVGIDGFIITKISKLPLLNLEMIEVQKILNSFLFINGMSFVVAGFVQFLFELREIYRLISYIYSFKTIKQEEKDEFFSALNKAKEKSMKCNESEQ